MTPFPTRRALALALALLALTRPAAADYVSQKVFLYSPTDMTKPAGEVALEAYDGGAGGGGLSAGQVRLTFRHYTAPGGGMEEPGGGPIFRLQGFQGVGFNTDLTLTTDQIVGPTGWLTSPGVSLGSRGTFDWAVGTPNVFLNDVSVLITGLGANATLDHFRLNSEGGSGTWPTGGPAQFAGQWLDIAFGPGGHIVTELVAGPAPDDGANETPEPASLALGGLGLMGLLAARWRRKVA